MKTNNRGIDYAAGQPVNRNTETGIRYGIIPQNSLDPNALNDVFQNGDDLDYAGYCDEAKNKLRSALSDFFSDYKHGEEKQSQLDSAVENAFDAISDSLGDTYPGSDGCTRMGYNKDGLKLLTDSSGELWVTESPFFTYAQFCSPCAPGACYLKSPIELHFDTVEMPIKPPLANKCYCLPADWFDDSQCPYPVFDVKTGKLVS